MATRLTWAKRAVLILGSVLALVSVIQLERARLGIERIAFTAGPTPATLYQRAEAGPLVVISHGFAGSQRMMEAYALTLARAGARAVTFDTVGHGDNPVPMSGDVTVIEGTTKRLIDQTEAVVAAARARTGWTGPVALVGHSMASDVVIRTALADPGITDIVAISMYSEAVTDTEPARLLIVTGDWEPHLRAAARDAVQRVDAAAEEGQTVTDGAVVRRAAVAPNVEHVGVLYSPAALAEARDWLAGSLALDATAPVAVTGPWIAALLVSLIVLSWPLAARLPVHARVPARPPSGVFWAALALPAPAAPLLASLLPSGLIALPAIETLALMLALYGLAQIAILARAGVGAGRLDARGLALLLVWGLGVFGLALDRYAANFVPPPDRIATLAVLALGTVPVMVADAMLTRAGEARLWRRIAARLALIGAVIGTVLLEPGQLFFLAMAVPLMVLFFLVHGLMGRWVGRHSTPLSVGLALGLILAWALGTALPLYDPLL